MRYRRSVLGPGWLTLQTALFIGVISLVFSGIFGIAIQRFLPFFTVSFVMWTYLSSSLLEGAGSLGACQSLVKDKGLHPYLGIGATFWRINFHFLHNLPIVILVFLYFQPSSWKGLLMALPGFALFFLFCGLLIHVVAPIAVRFHDVKLILESMVTLLFPVSPIFWEPASIPQGRSFILTYNPVYHLFEIWRAPLMDGVFASSSFVVVVAMLVVLLGLSALSHKAYKRVALWM